MLGKKIIFILLYTIPIGFERGKLQRLNHLNETAHLVKYDENCNILIWNKIY